MKDQLRKSLAARISTSQEESFLGSELDSCWDGAEVLLAYSPLRGEPDPEPFITEALKRGLCVYLPRVTGPHTMEFRLFEGYGALVSGAFKIREPDPKAPILDTDQFTGKGIVLVPGLGFDLAGGRLGRGRGYYDRFLAALPPSWLTLGLGWNVQVLERIPMDAWDIRLKALVTPGRFHWAGPQGPVES